MFGTRMRQMCLNSLSLSRVIGMYQTSPVGIDVLADLCFSKCLLHLNFRIFCNQRNYPVSVKKAALPVPEMKQTKLK